ncbi:RES family NAD+ phosphorylase [Aliivibrio finisterrensis]|uniref:RES domain-containing protein n=1 Tax=Aliivibrio finisterrensis TaxID=511998 RepID=A0ABY0I5A4_9GAMM|nr:RES family NAD+ phosphorylase [Aliivibrio finisterrensis]RYU63861.1 hypothetical protein ERW53_11770 [Aliivibrio finisterrensis]RYU82955.1 hypothetical protein ERW52_13865 [Aliivibrio finisterrensis]
MATLNGAMLIAELRKLAKSNKLPTRTYALNTFLYRVQPKGKLKAYFMHAPSGDLGRYNDPLYKLKVGYFSLAELDAIGETFCRNRSVPMKKIRFGHSDILAKELTVSSTKLVITVLDVSAFIAKIGIPLDEMTGLNYELCQAITQFFSENSSYGIDGLAYTSRHSDIDKCLALWESPSRTQDDLFQTVSMNPLADYVEKTHLPSYWKYNNMEIVDILSEIFNVDIYFD